MWKVAIEKGIVNGLAVLKENYAQIAPFLRDIRPSSNTAIRLYLFVNWVFNRLLDPMILDADTVGASARISEVGCCFHSLPRFLPSQV